MIYPIHASALKLYKNHAGTPSLPASSGWRCSLIKTSVMHPDLHLEHDDVFILHQCALFLPKNYAKIKYPIHPL